MDTIVWSKLAAPSPLPSHRLVGGFFGVLLFAMERRGAILSFYPDRIRLVTYLGEILPGRVYQQVFQWLLN